MIAKRLGELLVEQGLLTPARLESALEVQRGNGEFLGAILVRKGWVTEDALLTILAQQAGIPYVHLDAAGIEWAVASRFALPALVAHHCLALRMDAESMTVAIANPLEAWPVSDLERLVGERKIQLVLARKTEIAAAIQQARRYVVESLGTQLKQPDHGRSE